MTHRPDTLTFAGPPCLRGHMGRRYRSSGRCVECTAEDAAIAWQQHKARVRALRTRAAALGAGRG